MATKIGQNRTKLKWNLSQYHKPHLWWCGSIQESFNPRFCQSLIMTYFLVGQRRDLSKEIIRNWELLVERNTTIVFILHIYTLIRNSLDKQHYPPTPPPYTHTCTELSPGERGLGEGLQRLPIQIIGNLSNGPGWILTKLLAYVARHSSEAKWVASLRWNVWPHRLLNYWLKFCTDANKQDFWLVKYSNLFLVVLSKFIIPYKPLEYNPRYLETKLTKKYQVLVKCRSQYISISCGSNNTGSWFT